MMQTKIQLHEEGYSIAGEIADITIDGIDIDQWMEIHGPPMTIGEYTVMPFQGIVRTKNGIRAWTE